MTLAGSAIARRNGHQRGSVGDLQSQSQAVAGMPAVVVGRGAEGAIARVGEWSYSRMMGPTTQAVPASRTRPNSRDENSRGP